MLDERLEGLLPLGGLLRIGVDELGEVEVLDRVRLIYAHAPIFPSKGS